MSAPHIHFHRVATLKPQENIQRDLRKVLLQAQEQRPHLVVELELDDSLVVIVFRVRENLELNARSLHWILEHYEGFEHFIADVLEQLVGGTAGKAKSRLVLFYLEPVGEQFAVTGGPDSQNYH